MDFTPDKYVERLLEVSNKKYILLSEMLVLTQNQSEKVNEEGLDTLGKLINEKQLRIDKIDKLDEEFNVYFNRLKHVLKVKSLDELMKSDIKGIRELQGVVGKIMGTVDNISTIEMQNNSKAKELLGEFGNEIKKINQGKKSSNAYTPRVSQVPSYYIDKKK